MTNEEKRMALCSLMGPDSSWMSDEVLSERIIAMSKAFGWYKVSAAVEVKEYVIKLWKHKIPIEEIAIKVDRKEETINKIIRAYKKSVRRA